MRKFMAPYIAPLVLFMVPYTAPAFELLKLQEVGLTYRQFVAHARHPLLYPEAPKEALGVNLNIDIVDWLYWNPSVYAMTTESQYRSVGLAFNLGVHLTRWLDISYYHQSQHLLERQHSYMNKFPVEDGVEVKIYLFRAKESSGYILGF